MPEIDFGHVPLIKVTRGEVVESVHYGAWVVVDSRGEIRAAAGSPEASAFLRSAAKPFQVLPLLQSGAAEEYGLTRRELAVIIASHNGEKMHLEAVRSILRKIGCPETALQCGAHLPYHRPSAAALLKAGRRPSAIHNNCSGKHAGFLALARFLKASRRSYLDAEHPVQQAVRRTLAEYTGAPEAALLRGIDGCSAPTFALSLRQAALGYARLVDPGFGDAARREAAGRAIAAMRAHPEMIGGTGRLCTRLLRAVNGSFIAKIGAEGLYGMAYRDGNRAFGIALKIADGNGERARTTAAVELLVQLRLLRRESADRILASQSLPTARNVRGRPVGRVAPLFSVPDPPLGSQTGGPPDPA